jgi:para-nitrobenzyl esterase
MRPDASKNLRTARFIAVGLAVYWLLMANVGAQGQLSGPTVMTDKGELQGTFLDGGVSAFLGIPYAAPPVGLLRFRPPAEALPWFPEVRSATAFGPVCPRKTNTGAINGSEDCLTLDVWAPAAEGPHPVIVFVHPGLNAQGTARSGTAFYGGSTFTTTWDGQPWAANRNIVFVSVEWRVNALGFLAHPALSAENPNGSSGNYGILDQIAALQWVQRNIGTFGGDPSNVTVLGATGGAADVSVLVVSDLAKGLFRRAILESPIWSRFPTLQEAEQGVSSQIIEAVGCASDLDVPDCLRTKPMADIVGAAPIKSPATESGDYAPRIDGFVLKGNPVDLVAGDLAPSNVPLLIGSTADEINAHALDSDVGSSIFSPTAGESDYEAALKVRFGDAIGGQVLSLYPDSDYSSSPLVLQQGRSASFAAMLAVLTDSEVTCPVRRLARDASTGGRTVYRYFFTHSIENDPKMQSLGAFDNEDNWFVFKATPYPFTYAEAALADTIRSYWAAFAATGDPNGGSRTGWPAYERLSHNDNFLELNTTATSGNGVRTEKCDFWDFVNRTLNADDADAH